MYQNDIFYRKANKNALTSKQSDVTKKKNDNYTLPTCGLPLI